MEALAKLIKFEPFQSKLAKRRCCILAVQRNLFHETKETREMAIRIATTILTSHVAVPAEQSTLYEANQDLLVRGLLQTTLQETCPKLLVGLLDTLQTLLANKTTYAPKILKVFFVIFLDDNHDDEISTRAARHYLAANLFDSEILSNWVDFLQHSHPEIRSLALERIPAIATQLLSETALVENLTTVSHDDKQCCLAVFKIVQQLLFDPANHPHLLEHEPFIAALVRLVTAEPVVNRGAFGVAVEIVLDSPTHMFASHPELLPWMITLANRTTCEDLKARLIAAIVQLSTVIMEE
jgi:hypothetical protein